MFENKLINGEYATRYIASWVNMHGDLNSKKSRDVFQDWLVSLGLNEVEVWHIVNLATCGKMELEHSAIEYVNKHKIV